MNNLSESKTITIGFACMTSVRGVRRSAVFKNRVHEKLRTNPQYSATAIRYESTFSERVLSFDYPISQRDSHRFRQWLSKVNFHV